MARGISISITRILDEIREPRRDDPGDHSIWTGTRWVSLASPPCPPHLAERWKIKPSVHTTRLEFLPPGVRSFDAESYRRGICVANDRSTWEHQGVNYLVTKLWKRDLYVR